MDIDTLLKRLDQIRDDADSYSGCSHEDALFDGLKDIEEQIQQLMNDIAEEKQQ